MRRAVTATVAACVAVWVLGRWVIYDFFQIGDTRVYAHAARFIDAGLWPYRDFDVEYPPLATGLFWLVGQLPGTYELAFSLTMMVFLAATAVAGLVAARRLGLSSRRQAAVVGLIALSPVVLGTLLQTRYDLLLAALLGWALVAALHDRFGWMWVLVAVAIAVKLVPLLLVPVLMVWHAHRRGRRRALRGGAAAVGGALLSFLPFVVVAPSGVWHMFAYHLNRPAEIGSLPSSIVHALGLPFAHVNSYGSENVAGPVPDALATLCTLVLIGLICAIALRTRRLLRVDSHAAVFVTALVATMLAMITFGKVLSPQYLAWLLPAALLIPGRRGVVATGLMAIAMGATQLNFPLFFPVLIERSDPLAVTALAGRNLLLVILLVLAWPRVERRRSTRSTAVAVAS